MSKRRILKLSQESMEDQAISEEETAQVTVVYVWTPYDLHVTVTLHHYN